MLSFLYPEEYEDDSYHVNIVDRFSKTTFEKTGCEQLLSKDILDYFTCDKRVIEYRYALFTDILSNPSLMQKLLDIKEAFKEYFVTVNYIKSLSNTFESKLRNLVISNIYIKLMDLLKEKISDEINMYKSEALIKFCKSVNDEIESEDYKLFKTEILSYMRKLDDIKSITVGVNLDSDFIPKEAGLISINTKPFKSSNSIDKFLRLDFKKDEFECVAPLTLAVKETTYNEKQKLDKSIHIAIEKVIGKHLSSISKLLNNQINSKMQKYTQINNEFSFICSAIKFINSVTENKMPLCIPEINEHNYCEIKGMYDPNLLTSKSRSEIICNDIYFNKDKRIYILTGPNSGGKTVFIRSFAITLLMLHLGLPLPATSANMCISSKIIGVFINENKSTGKGRLEEECIVLAEILKEADSSSVILMDEAFSSTGYDEACELAYNYITKLSAKKSFCIYSTHLHDLCKRAADNPEIHYLATGVKNHRTYKVVEGVVSEKSFASDIAEKYW